MGPGQSGDASAGRVPRLLLGTPAGGPILWSLLWAAGITAVFMPLAMRAYRSESH